MPYFTYVQDHATENAIEIVSLETLRPDLFGGFTHPSASIEGDPGDPGDPGKGGFVRLVLPLTKVVVAVTVRLCCWGAAWIRGWLDLQKYLRSG